MNLRKIENGQEIFTSEKSEKDHNDIFNFNQSLLKIDEKFLDGFFNLDLIETPRKEILKQEIFQTDYKLIENLSSCLNQNRNISLRNLYIFYF